MKTDDPKDLTDLITVPPEDQMGEAMLALEPRQRLFVCALGVFGGDQQRAYAYAGYNTTNERSREACSSRLANSEKVVAAIREESVRRMNSNTLLAVSTLAELASPAHNSDKKLRLTAAMALLDRTGFNAKSEHTIVVKDERTTKNILAAIEELTGKMPVPMEIVTGALPAPIEAVFDEIPDELKDLL